MLFGTITDRYIIFGEWCYAKHSIAYNKLPDWFIAFDVYDKQVGKFMSCDRRNEILNTLEFSVVPKLGRGRYTLDDLYDFFKESQFSDSQAEGIYLRLDNDDWLQERAKLVNPNFIQRIENHWSHGKLTINGLAI